MGKSYIKRQPPQDVAMTNESVGKLAQDCNTYAILVQAMLNRGYGENQIRNLIINARQASYDVSSIPLNGAIEAAELIAKHIQADGRIGIFADYDCDGITSGYVMAEGIRDAIGQLNSKAAVGVYYPQRAEGYGLSMKYCKEAVRKQLTLVITVDNGITTKEQVNYLKRCGVEVLVTDHHQPNKTTLPDCLIVDPCYNDKERGYLAGVAVAYNVVVALHGMTQTFTDTDKYMPVVATGTISDCMPMTYENSCYVKAGIEKIDEGKAPAILDMLRQESLKTTPTDISFNVAPLVNASSRMGDTRIAAAGFFAKDKETVTKVLEKLNSLNNERKSVTNIAKKEVAKIQLGDNDRIVLFDGKDFNKGIHGIIAGEIAKRYEDYPAFVYQTYADDDGTMVCSGSIRCNNEALDSMKVFNQLKQQGVLRSCAGHKAACVITVEWSKLDEFRVGFSNIYDSLTLPPVIKTVDITASLKTVFDNKLLLKMQDLPFTAQDEVVFGVPNVMINEVHPSKSNPDNIQFKFADNTSVKNAWGWGWGERYKKMGSPKMVHLVCSMCQNFMMKNKVNATIRIIDMIPIKETTTNAA